MSRAYVGCSAGAADVCDLGLLEQLAPLRSRAIRIAITSGEGGEDPPLERRRPRCAAGPRPRAARRGRLEPLSLASAAESVTKPPTSGPGQVWASSGTRTELTPAGVRRAASSDGSSTPDLLLAAGRGGGAAVSVTTPRTTGTTLPSSCRRRSAPGSDRSSGPATSSCRSGSYRPVKRDRPAVPVTDRSLPAGATASGRPAARRPARAAAAAPWLCRPELPEPRAGPSPRRGRRPSATHQELA